MTEPLTPSQTQETTSETAQTQTDKLFSQSDLDRVVADRLARQKAQYESKFQKDQDEANARRLEEEKQYKTLADQRAAELHELKPIAEKATVYETLVHDLLKQQKDGLPAFVLEALEEMPVEKQVDYLKKNRAAIVKEQQSGSPNINAANRQAGSQTREQRIAELKQQARKSGKYTPL